MNEEEYERAIPILTDLASLPDLSAYERSTIFQMIGASQYELENFSAAITAFKDAVESGGLQPKEENALRVNIAQLRIASGQYAEGADDLEALLLGGAAPRRNLVEMLVQSLIQMESFDRAVPWAELWFEQADPVERKHVDALRHLYSVTHRADKTIELEIRLGEIGIEN